MNPKQREEKSNFSFICYVLGIAFYRWYRIVLCQYLYIKWYLWNCPNDRSNCTELLWGLVIYTHKKAVLLLSCSVDSMIMNRHSVAARLLSCRYNIFFLVLVRLSKTFGFSWIMTGLPELSKVGAVA